MDKSFLYQIHTERIEVGIAFDEFEEVSFVVTNEEDPQKAIDKVWALINTIIEEQTDDTES